jgi:GMP synthase (glutamine-hydrolysing)
MNVSVLHLHGDMFDIPKDTQRLASTSQRDNQAFSYGPNHIATSISPGIGCTQPSGRWLLAHAVELAAAGIDPVKQRLDARLVVPPCQAAARKMFRASLDQLSL